MTDTPMTREAVEALLAGATEGPWRYEADSGFDGVHHYVKTPSDDIVIELWDTAETVAHLNGPAIATWPDLARALLATMTELEQVKGAEKEAVMQSLASLGQAQEAYEAQKAAETALAAMTEREGVLRAFIDDFATAKIDALRYQPSYGESPEDEPDPVVDATEVWAWQSDAKDILALKETPNA